MTLWEASLYIAAPIWQKIPSDLSWGNDIEGDEHVEEHKAFERREPQDDDRPTGKWYHVSTQPLAPGTKIVPRGGPSPDPDFYGNEDGYDNTNRQNHVWLAPSLPKAHFWSWAMNAPHIHEVKPGDKPQPWNLSGTNGWVAPHAHVTRQVPPEEAKAAEAEYWKQQNAKTSARYAMPAGAPLHPDYNIGLFSANGSGGGMAGVWHKRVKKPTGTNWASAIAWDTNGKISNIDTKPAHQGRGLARALYEHVRDNYRPDLMHDRSLTDDGKAFSQAVGGQMYDDDEYQRRYQETEDNLKKPYEERQQIAQDRGWPAWQYPGDVKYHPRTAGMNGDLAESLTLDYNHWPVGKKFHTHQLTAWDGDNLVGHLSWDQDGHIGTADVSPEYQRRGIATHLLDHARANYDPNIQHSKHLLSDDGAAWKQFDQNRQASRWYTSMDDGTLDLVHYTPDYNVQSIMDNGFRAGRGEGGYGVYFTPMGTDYKERSGEGRVPIHVRFRPQNTLQMGPGDDDPGYQKYLDAAQQNHERPDIPLTEQGYDSAHYKDPWGGSQFIVFDPSKVQTIGPLNQNHTASHWYTAGARGETPPMTMENFNTPWNDGIMARHADDGRPLGHMHWFPWGEIDSITVHPDFQRMGVATAMLDHARAHPEIYRQAYEPIHHSNNLSKAGRAWANSDPTFTDPGNANVEPAEDDVANWGWTAVKNYVPAHIPYTGQNEAEMSKHLQATPAQTYRTAATQWPWPSWWDDKPHMNVPFDRRWSPNDPNHVTPPWEE